MKHSPNKKQTLYFISPDFYKLIGSILPKKQTHSITKINSVYEASIPLIDSITIIINLKYLENHSLSFQTIFEKIPKETLNFILLSQELKKALKLIATHKLDGIALPYPVETECIASIISNRIYRKEAKEKEMSLQKRNIKKTAESEKYLLMHVAKLIAREEDFNVVSSLILKYTRQLVYADSGSIYITEENKNGAKKLRFKSSALDFKTKVFTLPIDNKSIAGYVALTGKSLRIKDVYKLPKNLPFTFNKEMDHKYNYRTKSVLAIPMVNHLGEVMGVLQLINRHKHKKIITNNEIDLNDIVPFTNDDHRIAMAMANYSAISLYNQKLINNQRSLFEKFISLINAAIDAKSQHTGAHCDRVPILVEMLTEAVCEEQDGKFKDFQLTKDEWYELKIASELHDCGKIVTPVHIIDKATKLETIFDRINAIDLRFEILRRDAEKEKQDHLQKKGIKSDKGHFEKRLNKINEMESFIRKINEGGEYLTPEDEKKIKEISKEKYFKNNKCYPLLNKNEIENLSIHRGTLTEKERLIINGHMVDTINMLNALPFPSNLKRVPEYASGHHEKMDGTGYPRGIYGGDMSIPARIMAIADVFEALTASDRPYKKGLSISKAMKIMGEMKEKNHFDPDIFNVFIKSKVYLNYAKKYLSAESCDEINEKALIEIIPKKFTLDSKKVRAQRWKNFLDKYKFMDRQALNKKQSN